MIIVTYLDWFGTPEGFEKYREAWRNACEETEGVKSTKLYTSHQARYHYAWISEVDSYGALLEATSKMPPRDRNELTHAIIEVFTEM